MLLDRICAREAEIEAGIDGSTVRRILERLATIARGTDSGVGPLSPDNVIGAFSEICGYEPDEKGMALLQRIPGLGIERADEGTRSFIDDDFADACRAGDVVAFIVDPYGTGLILFRSSECGLGALGVGVSTIKTQALNVSSGKLSAAIKHASEHDDVTFLALDLARVTLEAGYSIEVSLQFSHLYIPSLELYHGIKDCSRLNFHDCYFSKIEVDPEVEAARLPRFRSCYVDELEGRSSRRDMPQGVFDEGCVFERFLQAPETTDAIEAMDLPLGARVLLTVLKKVYLQSGSGRKENALHRGLDHHGRRLVAPVLRLLQAEGLVSPYRRGGLDMTIWIPDRGKITRAARIITSPHTCGDPVLVKASGLS